MPRQIITASAEPSGPLLEHRIAVLERQIAQLNEALRALAAVVESTSPTRLDDGGSVSATRPEPDLLPLGN